MVIRKGGKFSDLVVEKCGVKQGFKRSPDFFKT